ncbi:MAG TPA: phytanoyl-CoA dioxygenase family protein [Caulobacteraceae bacterium]|jgi:ectoine hydroxylase-related dioxygenase (phytanoyl-CoA dioxygenase family)|nr:phytanoyl-CoA dioxygenase family protein [Caulobacteraceae bacterium]
MSPALDPETVRAFRRDGAVPLRALVCAADVAALREGVDALMARPSPRAKLATAAGDPGLFFEDFCNWREIAAFRRFVEAGPLGAAAGALMGARQARFYHDHVLVKEGGTRTPTPWHQDQPYYNIDGAQSVSFWIPLDPVGREATLEFLAGSHLGPWLMPRGFADREARWFPEGALADLPDIEADRAAFPLLGWALEPGDAVAFHMLTLHAAAGSDRRRRVFSARFIGDDMRHAPRPWTTSPDFPGLADELAPGAPMDHPLFPIVWVAS